MKKYSKNGVIVGANSPLFTAFFDSKNRDMLTHFSCVAAKNKRKIIQQKLKKQQNVMLDNSEHFDTVIIVLDIVELRDSALQLLDQLKELNISSKTRVYIVAPKPNEFNIVLNKKSQLSDNLIVSTLLSRITHFLLVKDVFSIDFIYYYNLISRDRLYLDYIKNTLYYNDFGYETLFSDISQVITYTYLLCKLPYPNTYGRFDVNTTVHKVITGSSSNNKYIVDASDKDNGCFVALSSEKVLMPYKLKFDWAKTKLLLYSYNLI